jgi:hypothetical protein
LQFELKKNTIPVNMKKIILITTAILFSLAGCTLSKTNAGIQIKSNPESKVFINDKETGESPYKNDKMTPGEYTVKLQADDATWSDKVRLTEGTVLYINRELTSNPDEQSGEIISLEKGKGITVVTTPSQVELSLDGQKQGNTPYLIPSVSAGVHELTLVKEGYLSKTVKVKAVDGYKIIIEVQLKPEGLSSESPEPSASAIASPSGSARPTTSPRVSPSASVKASATPKASGSPAATAGTVEGQAGTVTILSTPTGWLRVRDKAGIDGKEVTKVNTGDTLSYTEQLDTGWTVIVLPDGTKGYVVTRYVKVNKN